MAEDKEFKTMAEEDKELCEKTGPEVGFMGLPDDIKLIIFNLLPGCDIAMIACVSSSLKLLTSNNDLWKQKYKDQLSVLDHNNHIDRFLTLEYLSSDNYRWREFFVERLSMLKSETTTDDWKNKFGLLRKKLRNPTIRWPWSVPMPPPFVVQDPKNYTPDWHGPDIDYSIFPPLVLKGRDFSIPCRKFILCSKLQVEELLEGYLGACKEHIHSTDAACPAPSSHARSWIHLFLPDDQSSSELGKSHVLHHLIGL